MIILDSNVISELMRPSPNPVVVSWLDQQPIHSIWTTSISIFEIHMGLCLLPKGKKRQKLENVFEQVLHEDLCGRVLEFDTNAAIASSKIASRLQSEGKPVDMRDLFIAGTVAVSNGVLATRNMKHFLNTEINLINPWDS